MVHIKGQSMRQKLLKLLERTKEEERKSKKSACEQIS